MEPGASGWGAFDIRSAGRHGPNLVMGVYLTAVFGGASSSLTTGRSAFRG